MDIEQERRLVTEIPGPRSKELLERRLQAVPRGVFGTVPIFVDAAFGGIVRDVDGNSLIDLGAGLAVLNTGNSAPAVVEAARELLGRFTHTCFHVTLNEPYVAVAERLNELVPGDEEHRTMFVNSGAEAVVNAVKISRYFTKRQAVVVVDHAFHGRTLLAMSMTAKVMPYKQGLGPFAPEVYRVPFAYPYRCPTGGTTPEGCSESCATRAIDQMDKQIGAENIACLVVEPVLGERGFVVPGPGFLPRLAEYCKEHGILFVADEVQTGLGRTGRWFGIQHEGVVPDLVTNREVVGRRATAGGRHRAGRGDGERPRGRPRRHVRGEPRGLRGCPRGPGRNRTRWTAGAGPRDRGDHARSARPDAATVPRDRGRAGPGRDGGDGAG
jgi:4-aminobutyrate aminotransferase / (S)-3-amino-2-methylpropionate transaminase / 5-aminovalerate transaminase